MVACLSPMPKIVGERPHPSGLILGFDAVHRENVAKEFASSQIVTSLDEVDPHEWDVVVTDYAGGQLTAGLSSAPLLNVISFSRELPAAQNAGGATSDVVRRRPSRSTQ